jgi:hypothetical protein
MGKGVFGCCFTEFDGIWTDIRTRQYGVSGGALLSVLRDIEHLC